MKVVFPTATAALLLGAFSDANAEKSNLRRRTEIVPTSSGEDVIGDVSSLAALSTVQLSDFDEDADGELSIVEFINALQAAGISMTLAEVESLFASLDTSGNTLVRIQDLDAAIAALPTSAPTPSLTSISTPSPTVSVAVPVSNVDTIGDVSSLAAFSAVQLSDFDEDADGELSIVEFINALQAAGISMTLEEVESLFASLDTSGNTLVRIQDLDAAIAALPTSAPTTSPTSISTPSPTVSVTVPVSNVDTIGDVSSLAALSTVQLSDFDEDADGELSIVEFINALQAAGISMTLEEVESLFASLDTSGNTLVRIQDLDAAIAALPTSAPTTSPASISTPSPTVSVTVSVTVPVSNVDTIGDVSSLAAFSAVQLSDFDEDADGELSIVEFINALQAAGISMTLEEVESLFASLDTSGNTLVRIQDLDAAIAALPTSAPTTSPASISTPSPTVSVIVPVSNVDTIGDVSSLAALSTVQLSDFDEDADGELSIVEFINALQAAGISMTLEEVESLFASLDTSGNTLVRIQDLDAAIAALPTSAPTTSPASISTPSPTVSVIVPVSNVDTIGDVSSLAALSTVQLSDFDEDADGELSIVEFINALQAAGISMSLAEVESLFASLDTSGNTLVRIQDLDAAIAALPTSVPTPSPTSISIPSPTASVIVPVSNVDTIGDVSSLTTFSAVQLSDFDEDADGELSIVEFINALQAAGISMTLEEVESLFASLDTSGNTLVRIQDLDAAIAALPTSAPTTSPTSTWTGSPVAIFPTNMDSIGDVSSLGALSTVQLSDFDTDADGELAIVEFIAALEAAGIIMTLEEVETLFASLDTSGNALVRIQDLETAVASIASSTLATPAPTVSVTVPVSNIDTITDVSSIVALSTVQLSDFDTDADGELAIVEFITALESAGITTTLEEVEALFASLDTSGNGLIRIEDLETAVVSLATLPPSLPTLAPIPNVDTIGDISSIGALSTVQLSDFDTDVDGELSIVEFIAALEAAGISMTLEETESLFASLDTNGNTMIRIQDLESAVGELSTNVDPVAGLTSSLQGIDMSTFDLNSDGLIGTYELTLGLINSGVSATPEEIFALRDSLDLNGNGYISIAELNGENVEENPAPINTVTNPISTVPTTSNLAEAISELDVPSFDINSDGEITAYEFTLGLINAGVSAPRDSIFALMNSFDMNGNGRVAITEYQTSVVLESIQNLDLTAYDTDSNGKLNTVEFTSALVAGGVTNMSIEELQGVFGLLDSDGDNFIPLNELEALVADNSNIDLGNYSVCGDINLFQLGESLNSLIQSTPDLSSVEGAQALRELFDTL